MIYLQADDGETKIIVLETENLRRLAEGKPAVTADKSVIVCWTPDLVWLADKIIETKGDVQAIAALIDEASKRPQKPARPGHAAHRHVFPEGDET